jgi:hypothetical protein
MGELKAKSTRSLKKCYAAIHRLGWQRARGQPYASPVQTHFVLPNEIFARHVLSAIIGN